MSVADIGKKDFFWTLLATFFKIGAGVLLFPFVLRMLPAESVGIWTIFTTITQLTFIFDFILRKLNLIKDNDLLIVSMEKN